MEHNFRACLDFVLEHEGGYVDHPDDPGGATNLGITIATLKRWRGRAVSKAEVRALTRQEAAKIYHALYWTPAGCGDLPAGIDLLVFDAAVNMGIEPSLNFVRAQLGLPLAVRDRHKIFRGAPKLMRPALRAALVQAAAQACRPALILGVCQRRNAYYRGLKTFGTFGKGWLRRTARAQHCAFRLWSRPPMPLPLR
jgi:lysozyme family protein